MNHSRNPVAIGVVVLAVLAGVLYLASARGDNGPDDAGGGMLSSADREALDAAPVGRGTEAAGRDPSVDLKDPVAVATAYVVAGYSLRDTDAGHTNRRAVPYAAPATPPSRVGVLVVTPPPPGRQTRVTVTDVNQVSGEETGTRRGYVVGYLSTLDPSTSDPPGQADPSRHTRYLLLLRQIDGQWLVAGDSAEGQVGEP